MQREDKAWLADIVLACRAIRRYSRGMSYREFAGDERTQDAVFRRLEVIGEAANRLSQSARETCADVPWPQIVGMRNRLIHGYFEIDLDKVWRVVQEEIHPLLARLEKLVELPPDEVDQPD
jgi:uncharacterized protein with HEPN domain